MKILKNRKTVFTSIVKKTCFKIDLVNERARKADNEVNFLASHYFRK